MIRRIAALVVVAALVYAGWHVGVAWSRYRSFQDAVREVALFGEGKSDDLLRAKVMDLAAKNSVTLQPSDVKIERPSGEVTIEAHYVESVTLFPGYARQIEFTVK